MKVLTTTFYSDVVDEGGTVIEVAARNQSWGGRNSNVVQWRIDAFSNAVIHDFH
jgi:hypothetical protein